MNPLSPIYYIRNNKGRAALIIFMLFFTTLMFMAGNFVASCDWYWEHAKEDSDRIALIEWIPGDEDMKDYKALLEELSGDPKLHIMERTGFGFGGLSWYCTIGVEMGSVSYVFNSKEDMEAAFRVLGLTADLSQVKNGSIVISRAMANNKGIRLGDVIDATVDRTLNASYPVDALIEEDTFVTFYLIEDDRNLVRAYVYADDRKGDALYGYLEEKIGDRKVKLDARAKAFIDKSLMPFYVIMIAGTLLLSVILAVTVNSVVNGQYQKRVYEFGVYRALGLSRKTVFRKCAAELILMDGIAIVIGAAVHFLLTFLLNELLYIPEGKYLPYVTGLGGICFGISNLTVLIPMLIAKGHRMGKADVTEF